MSRKINLYQLPKTNKDYLLHNKLTGLNSSLYDSEYSNLSKAR